MEGKVPIVGFIALRCSFRTTLELTVRTLVGPLASVHPHVLSKRFWHRTGKRTLVAFEWLLPGVATEVYIQVTFLAGLVGTQATLIGLGARVDSHVLDQVVLAGGGVVAVATLEVAAVPVLAQMHLKH